MTCTHALPGNGSLVAALEEWRCFEGPAIEDGDVTLSHADLAQQSDRLAAALAALDLSGPVLGLALPGSADLVVATVAGVKAGLTLLPLDISSPPERLSGIVMETGCRDILLPDDTSALPEILTGQNALSLRRLQDGDAGILPGADPQAAAARTAVLFFTSGSTGRPKGVMTTEAGITRLAAQPGYIPMLPGMRYACIANPAFDAINFDIWAPLLTGGTAVVVPAGIREDPQALDRWLRQERIDACFMTVALFNAVVRQAPQCFAAMRHVLIGGEQVNAGIVKRWYQQNGDSACVIHNAYGPTEGTTFALSYPIPRDFNGNAVPVGGPLPHTGIRLGADDGDSGELWLSGPGLARGYHGRKTETGRAFFTKDGKRYYRTGDLMRRNAEGLLFYEGRVDRQVKIRGFRVEPGEIEARLTSHPDITEAHVCTRRSAEGHQELLAFVTGAQDMRYEDYRAHLRHSLPPWMYPHASYRVDAMPLNANGKVDRARLLEGDHAHWRCKAQEAAVLDDLTQEILQIAQRLLQRSDLTAQDSFIELGGDSLLALRLAHQIHDRWGKTVPSSAILNGTIAAIKDNMKEAAVSVPGTHAGGDAPMTAEQLRLWLMAVRNPEDSAYAVPIAFCFEHRLDRQALQRSVSALVQRHAALRTVFLESDEGPVQRVLQSASAEIGVREVPEAAVDAALDEIFNRQFDLSVPDLFRVYCLDVGEGGTILVLHAHHIILDGWSLELLLDELSKRYAAACAGQAFSEPADCPDTRDIALRQQRRAMDEQYQTRCRAAAGALDETLDRAEPLFAPAQSGASRAIVFDTTVSAAGLTEHASRLKTTRFELLQSLFAHTLSQQQSADRFLIATPVANRSDADLARTVGMCANTVLIPVAIPQQASFAETLTAQALRARETLKQSDLAYGDVISLIAKGKRPSGTLCDAMFVLETTDYNVLNMNGSGAQVRFPSQAGAKSAVLLTVIDLGAELRLVWELRDDLFDAREARDINAAFAALLENLSGATGRSDSPEIADIVQGPAKRLSGRTLIGRFLDVSVQTPDATALSGPYGDVSYRELAAKVRSLAGLLAKDPRVQHMRTGPCHVALYLPPGILHISALLALAHLGVTALPLDPSYPKGLLDQVLRDVQPAAILTSADAAGVTFEAEMIPRVLELGDADLMLPEQQASQPAAPAGRPLYMLFTSGSTGHPKAVEVPERVLRNLLEWQAEGFAGTAPATQQFAKLSFDVSFQEIFGTLCFAGRLNLVQPDMRQDPALLLDVLERDRIERLFVPFVALQEIARAGAASARAPRSLREVISAGEQLACTQTIRDWFKLTPKARLENQYGPTETHVVSSFVLPDAPEDWPETAPIGLPINNTGFRLSQGTLEVSGAGIAPAYFNAPGLNRQRYRSEDGTCWYRTGDKAVYEAGAGFRLTGRMDDEIKISGHRIVPRVIEAALERHAAISLAVVGKNGQGKLTAWVELTGEADSSLRNGLNRHLGQMLPAWAAVAHYRAVAGWPRTPSGKIDRRRLDGLGTLLSEPPRAKVSGEWASDRAARLAALFRETVGQAIAPGQSFFDAGASSLDLMRYQQAVLQQTGQRVPVAKLFQHVTINALADYLTAERGEPAQRMQAKARPAQTRAIAIVGIAVDMPGAPNVEALERMICQNQTGIRRIGAADGMVGAVSSIEQPLGFDAAYFGISPAEAKLMDPQQRRLMMNTVDVLADAGFDPKRSTQRIGMVASAGESTYFQALMLKKDDAGLPDGFQMALHHEKDFLATRSAYKLGMTGPALTLQTACSSALTGVHLAIQMLGAGDADVMVAGGVLIDPNLAQGYRHRPFHIFSEDGACRPFDVSSSGTVGASGACSIALMPLDAAEKAGARIYGIIEGSAINNDGAGKMSFSAPSVEGQTRVIRQAMERAGIDARGIGYVEAHGTGTKLGDPIEVEALRSAYGEMSRDIFLSSFKSQIGHMGAAAGLAGLIRATLAVFKGVVPPTLGYSKPNPEIGLAGTAFRVPPLALAWPEDLPRRAGVSSFGIGGTNAHVIVAAYQGRTGAVTAQPQPLSLTVRAASETALAERVRQVIQFLTVHPDQAAALCDHLNHGQPELALQISVTASDAASLIDELKGLPAAVQPAAAPGNQRTPDGKAFPRPAAFGTYPFDLVEYDARGPAVSSAAQAERLPEEKWLSQQVWIKQGRMPRPAPVAATAVLAGAFKVPGLAEEAGRFYDNVLECDHLDAADLERLGRVDVFCLDALTLEGEPSVQQLGIARRVCLDVPAEITRVLSARTGARLILVSKQAQPVEGAVLCPQAALLAGPAKVVAQETGIETTWIDVDRPNPSDLVAAAQLSGIHALRRGAVWSPEFRPVDQTEPVTGCEGVHLILGGTGGIGASIALAMLEAGAERVILVSRSARAVPAPLQDHAPKVTLIAGDIADTGAWNSLAEQISRHAPEGLNGIHHAAGTGAGVTIRMRPQNALCQEMASKYEGALFLEYLIARLKPAEVSYASSMAACFGGAGQYDYAAANAFLDGLAQSASRIPRFSIDWDIWRQSGMAAGALGKDATHQAHLEMGLSDDEGRKVFGMARASGLERLLVSTTPLPLAEKLFYGPRSDRAQNAEPGPSTAKQPDLSAYGILEDLLGMAVRKEDRLDDIGVDSLMMIDLVEQLSEIAGVELSPDALGPDATVGEVAELTSRGQSQTMSQSVELDTWRKGSAPHTICFIHPVGGDVAAYRPLAAELDPASTVRVIADPSLRTETPCQSLAHKACSYLDAIEAILEPGERLTLVGWSFGALVAHEMAVQRLDRGGALEAVHMIDPPLPCSTAGLPAAADLQADDMFLRELAPRLGGKTPDKIPGRLRDYAERLRRTCAANVDLMRRWTPKILHGAPVWLFVAANTDEPARPPLQTQLAQESWQRFIADLRETLLLSADHYSIVEGEAARIIANRISETQPAAAE